jgi:hypothetical protein
MPAAYATSVGLTVTIRKTVRIPRWVSVIFPRTYPTASYTLRGVNISKEGKKVLGGPVGTSDFARDMFETALSKYEAYGANQFGSSPALSHCASYPSTLQPPLRTFCPYVPPWSWQGRRLLDTDETFFEHADNATLIAAAEILGLPAARLPCNTHSDMFLPYVLDARGWGIWLPWQMRPTSERPVWQCLRYPFSFFATRSCARGYLRRSSNGAGHLRKASECYTPPKKSGHALCYA